MLSRIRFCRILPLLILGCAHISSADEDTASRFRSQAPGAWGKAIEFQGSLEGRYTKKMARWPSEEVQFSVEGQYKCIKGHRYLQYHLTGANGHSYQATFGLNPEYGFVLDRDSTDTNWKIKQIQQQTKEFALDRLTRQGAVLHAGFTVDSQSLLSTVRQPGFKLKDATTFSKEGVQLVRITFETDDVLRRDRGLLGGSVTLMPKSSWAVRDYEVDVLAAGEPFKVKGRLAYKGQLDGFPLATRSETWIGGMDGVYRDHETIEFSDIRRCMASVSDFTLLNFGPPDIEISQEPND